MSNLLSGGNSWYRTSTNVVSSPPPFRYEMQVNGSYYSEPNGGMTIYEASSGDTITGSVEWSIAGSDDTIYFVVTVNGVAVFSQTLSTSNAPQSGSFDLDIPISDTDPTIIMGPSALNYDAGAYPYGYDHFGLITITPPPEAPGIRFTSNLQVNLSQPITASSTTATLTSGSGSLVQPNLIMYVTDGMSKEEVKIISVSGDTLELERSTPSRTWFTNAWLDAGNEFIYWTEARGKAVISSLTVTPTTWPEGTAIAVSGTLFRGAWEDLYDLSYTTDFDPPTFVAGSIQVYNKEAHATIVNEMIEGRVEISVLYAPLEITGYAFGTMYAPTGTVLMGSLNLPLSTELNYTTSIEGTVEYDYHPATLTAEASYVVSAVAGTVVYGSLELPHVAALEYGTAIEGTAVLSPFIITHDTVGDPLLYGTAAESGTVVYGALDLTNTIAYTSGAGDGHVVMPPLIVVGDVSEYTAVAEGDADNVVLSSIVLTVALAYTSSASSGQVRRGPTASGGKVNDADSVLNVDPLHRPQQISSITTQN